MNFKRWVGRGIEMCTKPITVPRLDNYTSSYHSFSYSASCTSASTSLGMEKDESLHTVSEEEMNPGSGCNFIPTMTYSAFTLGFLTFWAASLAEQVTCKAYNCMLIGDTPFSGGALGRICSCYPKPQRKDVVPFMGHVRKTWIF